MEYTIVLGGGESGVWSAILAKQKGHRVLLSDSGTLTPERKALLQAHDVPFEEVGHILSDLDEATQVVKSPGIPSVAPIVLKCLSKGIPVISEIEFAARYVEPKQLIGVTGSNGKTTTTTLLAKMLQAAGADAVACGNIGKSLAQCVAKEPHHLYVVELSSFQLDHMYESRFHVALLLNITPDHLDRYDHSLNKYADAKGRIFQSQTLEDFAIYNADDPLTAELFQRNGYPKSQLRPFSIHKAEPYQALLDTALIKGDHNRANILASLYALQALGYNEAITDGRIAHFLQHFTGIEHRMEQVGKWRGVTFINDSKATNIDATKYALGAMPHGKTVLILGGTDKGNDYNEIKPIVAERCKALIYLTKDHTKLHATFDDLDLPTYDITEGMAELYHILPTLPLQADDIVLLSPACASFDLFKNYEDRGNQFKAHFSTLP